MTRQVEGSPGLAREQEQPAKTEGKPRARLMSGNEKGLASFSPFLGPRRDVTAVYKYISSKEQLLVKGSVGSRTNVNKLQ